MNAIDPEADRCPTLATCPRAHCTADTCTCPPCACPICKTRTRRARQSDWCEDFPA